MWFDIICGYLRLFSLNCLDRKDDLVDIMKRLRKNRREVWSTGFIVGNAKQCDSFCRWLSFSLPLGWSFRLHSHWQYRASIIFWLRGNIAQKGDWSPRLPVGIYCEPSGFSKTKAHICMFLLTSLGPTIWFDGYKLNNFSLEVHALKKLQYVQSVILEVGLWAMAGNDLKNSS